MAGSVEYWLNASELGTNRSLTVVQNADFISPIVEPSEVQSAVKSSVVGGGAVAYVVAVPDVTVKVMVEVCAITVVPSWSTSHARAVQSSAVSGIVFGRKIKVFAPSEEVEYARLGSHSSTKISPGVETGEYCTQRHTVVAPAADNAEPLVFKVQLEKSGVELDSYGEYHFSKLSVSTGGVGAPVVKSIMGIAEPAYEFPVIYGSEAVSAKVVEEQPGVPEHQTIT